MLGMDRGHIYATASSVLLALKMGIGKAALESSYRAGDRWC